MAKFDTLTEAVADLNKRGFTQNFILEDACVFCMENNTKLNPDDFEIVEYHRFEGMTDPSDSSVVYAIKSDKLNLKGVLIDSYGAYSNVLITDLIKKIKLTEGAQIKVS